MSVTEPGKQQLHLPAALQEHYRAREAAVAPSSSVAGALQSLVSSGCSVWKRCKACYSGKGRCRGRISAVCSGQ